MCRSECLIHENNKDIVLMMPVIIRIAAPTIMNVIARLRNFSNGIFVRLAVFPPAEIPSNLSSPIPARNIKNKGGPPFGNIVDILPILRKMSKLSISSLYAMLFVV